MQSASFPHSHARSSSISVMVHRVHLAMPAAAANEPWTSSTSDSELVLASAEAFHGLYRSGPFLAENGDSRN